MTLRQARKLLTIVLLGDIAAGKGTQAQIIAKRFRLKLIDTGAFTRKYWTSKSKISRRLVRTRLGKLTPTDIIQKYLRTALTRLGARQSILLDGGKMPAEARIVYGIFQRQKRRILVIYLRIPKTEIFRRLAYRYYCEKTGEPVSIKDGSAKCPQCGGGVIKRADDDLSAVKNRIRYYDRIYRKTVAFWRNHRLLKTINGHQPIAQVTKDIEQMIKNYYGTH